MTATYRVTNSAEFASVLNAVKGGETIILASSDSPYSYLSTQHKGSPLSSLNSEIIIKSEDADNPATFSVLELRGVQNITIDGVIFDRSAETNYIKNSYDVSILGSSNIKIQNCHLIGEASEQPVNTVDDFANRGIVVNNSQNITIHNNNISHYQFGVSVGNGSDTVYISDNNISFIQDDFMRIRNDNSNIFIEGNTLSNPIGNKILHQDFIHLWTDNSKEQGVHNLEIKSNTFFASDDNHQVIYIQNKKYGETQDPAFLHQGIIIEDNIIFNGSRRGISVANALDVEIRNNTMIMDDTTPDAASAPRMPIIETLGFTTGVIENNISGGLVLSENSTLTVGDNLIIEGVGETVPLAQWNLFADVRHVEDVTLDNLIALPGTAVYKADGSMYGSQRLDFHQYDGVLLLRNAGVDGYVNKVSFEVMAGGAAPSMDGATVRWDFGDGQISTGPAAVHVYAEPGDYRATMIVTYADGSQESRTTFVAIDENLTLLKLNISTDRIEDISANAAVVKDVDLGEIVFDEGTERYVLDISGDGLTVDGARALSGETEFRLSFEMRMAGDTPGDYGRVLSIKGLMAVDVLRSGELSVRINDITGSSTTIVGGGDVFDGGGWRDVVVDYSVGKGVMSVEIDGELIGQVTVSEAVAVVTGNLALGKVDGKSYGGLVADVTVSRPFMAVPENSLPASNSNQEITPDYKETYTSEYLVDLDFNSLSVTDVEDNFTTFRRVDSTELLWREDIDSFVFDVSRDGFAARDTSVLGNHENLQLSFLLAAQGDPAEAWGQLAAIRDFFVAETLKDGTLSVRMYGADGEAYEVITDAAPLLDGEWRRLDVDYAADDGAMSVWIDGAKVGEVAVDQALGLAQGNLSFGDNFGRSMNVHLADFTAAVRVADEFLDSQPPYYDAMV